MSFSTDCGCTQINAYNLTADCIPCTDVRCGTEMDAKCVIYKRKQPAAYSNLTCIGLSTDVSLQEILEKIDDVLCSGLDEITYENGLNRVLNSVKLGGTLIEETTVTAPTGLGLNFTGTNVRFPTYYSGRTPDTINGTFLFTDPTGKLMLGSIEDMFDDYETELTFDNGLTRTINNTQLGGNLVEPTVIDAVNEAGLIANDLWIKNNTAIGDTRNATDVARLLLITTATSTRTDVNGLYASKVYIDDIPTADSYGILGIQEVAADSTENLDFTGVYNSAISSQIIYRSDETDIIGTLNGVTSRLIVNSPTVSGGGDIENIVLFRANPVVDLASVEDYGGTITNIYGFYCDDLSAISGTVSGSITNSYGVYQVGASDVNYFNGRIRLTNTSCPIYADNTAADAALQSGEIYRLTGDRTIYMKP